MKYFLLVVVTVFLYTANGQNLAGVWNGTFTMKGDAGGCTAKITIVQSGSAVSGTTEYVINGTILLTTSFSGTVNNADSTFSLKEISTKTCSAGIASGAGCYGCKKTINGKWGMNGALMLLKGEWQSFTDTTPGDCYTCPVLPSCTTGTVEFRKINSCRQGLEFYMIPKLEAWKKQGKYEAPADWHERLKGEAGRKDTIINDYMRAVLPSENIDIVYDNTNQEFSFSADCIQSFKIMVPRAQARDFAENFEKGRAKLHFTFNPETGAITCDEFKMKNKADKTDHKYTIQ